MDVDKCWFSMDVGCSYSLPFREGFKKTVTETFPGRNFPKLKKLTEISRQKRFYSTTGVFKPTSIVFRTHQVHQVLKAVLL